MQRREKSTRLNPAKGGCFEIYHFRKLFLRVAELFSDFLVHIIPDKKAEHPSAFLLAKIYIQVFSLSLTKVVLRFKMDVI